MAWKQESVSRSDKYSIEASFQLPLTILLVWTIVFLLGKSCLHVLRPIIAIGLPVKPKAVVSFRLPANVQTPGLLYGNMFPKDLYEPVTIRCSSHHHTSTLDSRFSNPPPLQNQSKSDWSHKMASYPHNAASNKVKPWPAYFIVRASGEVVPLIGVDDLPIGTDLVGVPRALDLKDTVGMLNLGIQRRSEAFYHIFQREERVFTAEVAKTTK